MTSISEKEFARICAAISTDADAICRHNPVGTREEILLWMLLGCLTSYLSLSEIETPCFTNATGAPTAQTYRDAILYVLRNRRTDAFDAKKYLDSLKNV
jgi:hypothetical protein